LKIKNQSLKLEENIPYMGWPNCIRLSNLEVEMIIATDIGLRILHFGFIGEKNIFYLSPDDKGKLGGDTWRIYGGHRLWHAPEAIPRTYSPDNEAISFSFSAQTLHISQPVEAETGIIKEMEISLSADKNEVRILHRLINTNRWPVKLAAWALSVLSAGTVAIVPQEPYGDGDEYLLPARSLTLWSYTQMQDPRWIWGNKYIQAKQNSRFTSEQKIGISNKLGWAACQLDHYTLIKLFEFNLSLLYPDHGSNNEIYINGHFLELETLGPLVELEPQAQTEHVEYWQLLKGHAGNSEDEFDDYLLPQVADFRSRMNQSK